MIIINCKDQQYALISLVGIDSLFYYNFIEIEICKWRSNFPLAIRILWNVPDFHSKYLILPAAAWVHIALNSSRNIFPHFTKTKYSKFYLSQLAHYSHAPPFALIICLFLAGARRQWPYYKLQWWFTIWNQVKMDMYSRRLTNSWNSLSENIQHWQLGMKIGCAVPIRYFALFVRYSVPMWDCPTCHHNKKEVLVGHYINFNN